jgi:hypothetical protein
MGKKAAQQLVCQQVGWMPARLAGWLAGSLARWLAGWLARWLAGWLAGWLVTAVCFRTLSIASIRSSTSR